MQKQHSYWWCHCPACQSVTICLGGRRKCSSNAVSCCIFHRRRSCRNRYRLIGCYISLDVDSNRARICAGSCSRAGQRDFFRDSDCIPRPDLCGNRGRCRFTRSGKCGGCIACEADRFSVLCGIPQFLLWGLIMPERRRR